ncbi:MAG: hypothetical protein A2X31_02695 [Elusimicrobia bacterium GWB2_63_22]|nr:MAG: hypothetical protein A2X31_02695 [Elusimicrobia bacterium GWB2_63_22]
MSEEFKEFGGLAERLRRTDLSGESRVRNTLRESLLDRAERPRRRVPALAWLLPAAAAAAALFFIVGPRPEKAAPEPAAYAAAYSLPDDGFGACGRRGLDDYQAEGRF